VHTTSQKTPSTSARWLMVIYNEKSNQKRTSALAGRRIRGVGGLSHWSATAFPHTNQTCDILSSSSRGAVHVPAAGSALTLSETDIESLQIQCRAKGADIAESRKAVHIRRSGHTAERQSGNPRN
jgi:hypothetical protein